MSCKVFWFSISRPKVLLLLLLEYIKIWMENKENHFNIPQNSSMLAQENLEVGPIEIILIGRGSQYSAQCGVEAGRIGFERLELMGKMLL